VRPRARGLDVQRAGQYADQANRQEGDAAREREQHRDDAGDRPRQLEPGFEPGEGLPLIGPGRVALHDRVEGHAPDPGGEVGDARQRDRRANTSERGGADPTDRDHDDGRRQHQLLA
jgi:hypothetical protein